jgi:hypothetical protein
MKKCGIPPLLQKIVVKTCFSPRIVHFNGKGIFSHIGVFSDIDLHTRHVRLVRGMMMGDPLTKVILHFTNISIRELGRYIATGSYRELILDNDVRPVITELDTGPFSVLSDEIIITDTRPLITDEGKRQARTIPARVLPNPNILSLEEGDALIRRRQASPMPGGRERTSFPLPGVHVFYQKRLEGSVNLFEVGFIPKRYRDPALLSIKRFKIGQEMSYPVTGERNPDDTRLLCEGLLPINPYRSKEIRTDEDRLEADKDHASYIGTGRVTLNPSIPNRVVPAGTKADDTSWQDFLASWFI